jgi:hypothetical protein
MVSRREFLKAASFAGSAVVLNVRELLSRPRNAAFFGLHEFVETHPDAVFILRTAVDTKTNTGAMKDVGHQLGQNLFVQKSDSVSGYPVSSNVVMKPNITSWRWDKPPIEQTMGIQTDPYFVEGVFNSLRDVSILAQNTYIREANYSANEIDGTWYKDLAARTGLNLRDFPQVSQMAAQDIQWTDVPNGVWFNKIPHLWPVNSPGSCLINIAKLKSHSMGMTLCAKNLQGTDAAPYVSHCTAWGTAMSGVDTKHIAANAFPNIKTNYDRHTAAKIPRWDLPGSGSGGIWMETHASRCLDNNSVLHPLVNIIEGVYGREGPFVTGPDETGAASGYGRDMMTNIVIFGKNSFHVDVVGTYLAGHEPGNFGMFHMALERGLSKYLNPRDVPLYEWKLDGSASAARLENFPQTPIRTLYLRKAGEPAYHMVNEPYSYAGTTAVVNQKYHAPDVFAIQQNFPNPFNPSTSIQYHIPEAGNVRLEIFDIRGQVVDVLVDSWLPAGDHVRTWNSERRASGTYFYRLLYKGSAQTKSMILLK